jgi:hypothetical protein
MYQTLPEGLVLESYVRYYSNGWRVGRLDKWEKGMGIILPSCKDKHIKVSAVNIEPIEDIRGQNADNS